MKTLVSLAVALLLGALAQADAVNLARSAKVTVSSSRPEYPASGVNDGEMVTSWSTALGHVKGEWLRFDWERPQTVSCIALFGTGRWTQSLEVQALQGESWVTLATSGSSTRKVPLNAVLTWKPIAAKALRVLFDGGAAFFEVEIYDDPVKAYALLQEHVAARIVVSGDLRGHLIGTVSTDAGEVGLADLEVSLQGETPMGGWRGRARTDANGFFQAYLPLGTTRTIEIHAGKDEAVRPLRVDAGSIPTALTPHLASAAKSLNGKWDWAPLEGPVHGPWRKVNVPAHWEMEGAVAESGKAWYRRFFGVPAAWKGKRVKLRADAVYSRCEVWVNGTRIGSHEGGATPFEVDFTHIAKFGATNRVEVRVEARSLASEIDNASSFAYFELAGIWQPIEVFAVEPAHLSHLVAETTYDKAYRDASLRLEVDLVNEAGSAAKPAYQFRLFDPKGREVPVSGLQGTASIEPWGRIQMSLSATVAKPEPWNAELPRLYRLVGQVNGKKVVEQSVGFRQIAVTDRAVTLNGTPLKIRGISKLDSHPLMGRALTPEVDRLDTELMKLANFNAVRATIFPPHPAALDAADREGLYFENEGPTCWGGHADDLRAVPIYLGIMCEYLERDRNHPSVIDWSICNESDYARLFSITQRYMKQIDPTRLYSATWGDDSLDTATLHHPLRMDRIKESLTWSKPVYFDEVLTPFHGWEDLALWLDQDPGMMDYWVDGIPEMLRAINAGRNQLGSIQFSWVDDAFLVPGKGVDVWRHSQPPIRYTEAVYKLPKRGYVGDVAWGTLDGWRRPRPEYWLSKKLYSPVQIAEVPLALPASGPILVPVENFNQFADLDRYRCKWSLGAEKGETRAKCPPMGKGALAIPVAQAPKPDDVLRLEFADEKGRMVDVYALTFRAHEAPSLPTSGTPARIAEQGGYLDWANATRLIGKDCELAYDRTSVALLRGLKGGEAVLNAGPTLRLLKTTAPAEAYPTGFGLNQGVLAGEGPTVWRLASANSRVEGGQAVLEWRGDYGKDLVGGYEIRMDDAGDVEIRYDFTYHGAPIRVREVALEFALPLAFDRLEWDRRAEYSVYPPDHTGRPHGVAVAHPGPARRAFGPLSVAEALARRLPANQLAPAGDRPFGLDDHAWGCNDFRSTKRNVYWATLTNAQGEGVKVFGGGTQHVRATVSTHDILLRVMDYYGGEGWTYSGGFHYGEGKLIAPGDVLKGVVRLQLLGG